MELTTRIAPTPSGFLHQGNAFAFLFTAELARLIDAKILLRIDDLDAERKRAAFVEDIFDTLNWLKIQWQIGPSTSAEFEAKWSQHLRLKNYNAILDELWKQPGLMYTCTCSRREFDEQPGNCNCQQKNLPRETPDATWRIAIPEGTTIQFTDALVGKQNIQITSRSAILRRRDGLPAYQIASLVDDESFAITHIVRGVDLLPSTALQIWLAQRLNFDHFLQTTFLHHALLTNETGNKLSKSSGSNSLQQWRIDKKSDEELRQMIQPFITKELNAFRRSH